MTNSISEEWLRANKIPDEVVCMLLYSERILFGGGRRQFCLGLYNKELGTLIKDGLIGTRYGSPEELTALALERVKNVEYWVDGGWGVRCWHVGPKPQMRALPPDLFG